MDRVGIELPSPMNIGLSVVAALAAVGFGTIAAQRVRLVLESWRAGHRLEAIRSGIVAAITAVFASGAAYVAFVRLVGMFGQSAG